jgi:hypothetical protein
MIARERDIVHLVALGDTKSGDRQEALRLRSHGRHVPRAHRAELETPAELVMFAFANESLVRMSAETRVLLHTTRVPTREVAGRDHQNGMSALTAVPQTDPPIMKEET